MKQSVIIRYFYVVSFIPLERQNLNKRKKNRVKKEGRLGFKDFERQNTRARMIRIFFICVIFLALCTSIYVSFLPNQIEKLKNPLDILAFEAIALEKDFDNERLYLPSNNIDEIDQYLNSMPNLKFTPRAFKSLPNEWEAVGASLIDYGSSYISVTKYKNIANDEIVSFFSLPERIENISKSEIGEIEDFKYQAYSNNETNLIIWQDQENTLAALAGRLSAKDLAKLAAKGM